MKYLDCVELLQLALQILKNGQQGQVPVSRLDEVLVLLKRCSDKLLDLPTAQAKCFDLLAGISVVQANKSVLYLPQAMRGTLLQGISSVLTEVCEAAWCHYSVHDAPVNDQTIPLLRTIVEYHFSNGG